MFVHFSLEADMAKWRTLSILSGCTFIQIGRADLEGQTHDTSHFSENVESTLSFSSFDITVGVLNSAGSPFIAPQTFLTYFCLTLKDYACVILIIFYSQVYNLLYSL